MKLLDAVVEAETAPDRLRRIRIWERQYSSISEIAVDDRWSEELSQSLTQSRYPDLLRLYARLRRRYLDSLHRSVETGPGYPDDNKLDCHLTLYLLAAHFEDDEGHDWTRAEKALEALTRYGGHAFRSP